MRLDREKGIVKWGKGALTGNCDTPSPTSATRTLRIGGVVGGRTCEAKEHDSKAP